MSEEIILSNLLSIAALNASEIVTMSRVMLDCRKMPSPYIRESFDRLIGMIIEKIDFAKIKYGHDLALTALMNIIINLIVVTGQGNILGYTRNHNTYSAIKSLGFEYFTWKKYTVLIDELAAKKLVILSKGFHDKSDAQNSMAPTIRPSEALVEMIDKADLFRDIRSPEPIEQSPVGGIKYVVDPRLKLYDYEWFKNPLLVHIKDEKKILCAPNRRSLNIIAFLNKYNQFIKQSRLLLPYGQKAYNDSLLGGESPALLEQFGILLNTDGYDDAYITGEGMEDNGAASITKTNCCNLIYCKELETRLYRVANNMALTHGMRFYQHEYQNIRSELRPNLIIDNDPVTEYDYSSFHIRMLYHLEGIDIQEDPYDVFGSDPQLRKAVKLMTNISINASSETSAIRAMNDKLNRNKNNKFNGVKEALQSANLRAKDLLEIVKKKHAKIAKYFNSGVGIELQYKDSMLAESILDYFMKKEIPCLCIHDSFIVPRPYGDELKDVMEDLYTKRFGFKPIVNPK